MTAFEVKAAQLRRIERGDEEYGKGSRQSQTIRFYLDEMLDDVIARAATRSDRLPGSPVTLLISLCGFSPQTTVIAYELLQPERLVVVSSATAPESIDVIADHVVGKRGMRYSHFRHSPCNPTDPLDIYKIVKAELDKLQAEDGQRPTAIIDITGGRKVMSAAAALAAWQLELGLCYVDSDFDPVARRPIPGSDRLLILDNPTALFGEQEMAAAWQTFASGAFEAARRRYNELSDILAEPTGARFMRALSELYRAWCDLDLPALPSGIEAVELALRHARHEISSETAGRVEDQLAFLRRLPDGDRTNLLVCFFVLGQHYREVGRHDFAALLFYRAIEGCLSGRLESLASGFSCDRPDYTLLTADVPGLQARYAAIMHDLGRRVPATTLPPVIGLISAAILLTAQDDPLVSKGGLAGKKALSHLNEIVRARNKSVLAHGDETVGLDKSTVLEAKARSILRAYWKVQRVDGDIDVLCQRLRFVRTNL
jgi:hypothetical protein